MTGKATKHDLTALLMQCGRDVEQVFGRAPKARCEVGEHGWLGLSGEAGTADLNMCFIARTATAAVVERYAKEIADGGVAAIMIVDDEAPQLVEAATALGWTAVGGVPVMIWENGPDLRASDRYTVRIATEDEHEDVCRLAAQGFSLDEETVLRAAPKGVFSGNVEAWVAEADGELLGTGALVRSGDHAGVYMMATPAWNQRKGVGRAVLETAMAHHLASGATTFTLEATEAGFHLYEQLGYQTVATPTVLINGESTQFPG
jgi:N-acetylglutamate synthase-like GNAT family acetyltransferase